MMPSPSEPARDAAKRRNKDVESGASARPVTDQPSASKSAERTSTSNHRWRSRLLDPLPWILALLWIGGWVYWVLSWKVGEFTRFNGEVVSRSENPIFFYVSIGSWTVASTALLICLLWLIFYQTD